jgi:hypothetical protein
MPLHDWTRVPAGLFHDFHQSWSVHIKDALNAGRLPKGYSALVEQRTPELEADVLAIERRGRRMPADVDRAGGTATLAPPATQFVHRTTKEAYAAKANRIVVRHKLGRIVAVLEIVSPGNKSSRKALREFVEKSLEFLNAGVHVLIVDVFPPTPRDPHGIHQAIWEQLEDVEFTPPAGKDRILVSYEVGTEWTAHVTPIGLGDDLPDVPLFLAEDWPIPTPLESTYHTTWDASPEDFREAVETGMVGEDE